MKKKKQALLATSDQQAPGGKVVHTLPNILVEAVFFLHTLGPGRGLCL